MAVWDFNMARVYIKPRMPFSAKFHGCLENLTAAGENNPRLPFLKGHSSSKQKKSSRVRTTVLNFLGFAVRERGGGGSRLDHLRREWEACDMCSTRGCVCRGRIPRANVQIRAVGSAVSDG